MSDKLVTERKEPSTEDILSMTCNNNITAQDIVLEEKKDLLVTKSKVVLVE